MPNDSKLEVGKCPRCDGTGRFDGKTCVVCEGHGFWEYVADDNYLALQALAKLDGPVEERIAKICNNRLAGVTPDNIHILIKRLQENLSFGDEAEEHRYKQINKAGAVKWGWAWLNACRFAIELCKLNGVDFSNNRYAVASLVWGWLLSEERV